MLHSRHTQLAALVAGALLIGGVALAQERDQPQPRRSNQAQPEQAETQRQRGDEAARRQTAGEASRADAQLAACLIISNQKEIALAQFAQQHAQSQEVKDFAQKMVQDHEQFVSELQKFADQGGYDSRQLAVEGASPDRSTTNQPAARDQDEAQPRRAARDTQLDRNTQPANRDAAQQDGLDFIGLKQEIAQQCVQSAQQSLSEKPESEFDKCYMFSQVMAHMEMLDTLKVSQKHASPELQAVLQKGEQTTQQHLQHAEKLAEQVDHDHGASADKPRNANERQPSDRPASERRRENQ